MGILDLIASAQNRKDETPNIALAKQIVMDSDTKAVEELIINLDSKSKAIQSDCIKVLYEIGEDNPELIKPYMATFIKLLKHKNNRLQWGAMTALKSISYITPNDFYPLLPQLMEAASKGSVITRDNFLGILINISSFKDVSDLLFELLYKSPANQVPMYAERILPVISQSTRTKFINTLNERLSDIHKESALKRIQKVIDKATKL